MNFLKTELDGVTIIDPDIFFDQRGLFLVNYHKELFQDNGIQVEFIQDNVSRSKKGTLRGLHYQIPPYEQAKLVTVASGEVYDVAVDLRRDSATYAQWCGVLLNDQNRRSLFIPAGFAHGFIALSHNAVVTYKCAGQYNAAADRSIAWNDPQIGIEWPIEPDETLLSKKDAKAPLLRNAENPF